MLFAVVFLIARLLSTVLIETEPPYPYPLVMCKYRCADYSIYPYPIPLFQITQRKYQRRKSNVSSTTHHLDLFSTRSSNHIDMLWVFIAPFVLPFSLVVGKAIGETENDYNATRSARSGCSSECVFPFTYLGVTHYRCTDADHDRLWCATARDRNGGVTTWANCDQECHTGNIG